MSPFFSRPLSHVTSHFCSKRPWSLFIGLFLVLAILGPLLPFLFGRIMIIETFTRVRAAAPSLYIVLTFEQNQRTTYHEVLVTGDLSQDDVSRATDQLGAFQVGWPHYDPSVPVLTIPRTLPKHGRCFHMAEAPQIPSSLFKKTIPCILPNQVCPSSPLGVPDLGLSM